MDLKIKSLTLSLALLAVGCTHDVELSVEGVEITQSAVIVNSPSGATQGEILVKFRSSVSDMLDLVAPATRSGKIEISRVGIAPFDTTLDAIGSTSLQRVFPVNMAREELTRENSLHLWYVVRFDEQQDLSSVAEQLAAHSEVEIVEYSRTITPVYDRNRKPVAFRGNTTTVVANSAEASSAPFDDPNYSMQWHLNNNGTVPAINGAIGADINAEQAWEVETGDPSIIVAVLDEGVMYNHPDLEANMWINPAEEFASTVDADGNGYAGDRYGYNFVFDKGIITYNESGDTGHGTHVSGLISAVNNNGVGVSSIAGGSGNNDGVKIMACQIIDGYGIVTIYEEAQAMKYAADNGAVILQCSWGINSGEASYPNSSGYSSDEDWIAGSALEKEALDYFIHNAGSASGVIDGGIAIFAGGNEYAPMVGYPSRYTDYISVAALAADNTPASYTNYDSRVGISAPGGDSDYHLGDEGSILSTMPPIFDNDYTYYGYMDGTSMACPQVSGVVALGLSRAQKLRKHYKAENFMDMVLQSAQSIEELLIGYKSYYLYYDYYGDKTLERVALSRYSGKMGSGAIDARLLLDLVDDQSTGAAMKIPNYTVLVGESREDDLSQYFVDGGSTYSAVADSAAIASVSMSGSILTIEALSVGSTTVKISSDGGVDQSITVIVREESNTWL